MPLPHDATIYLCQELWDEVEAAMLIRLVDVAPKVRACAASVLARIASPDEVQAAVHLRLLCIFRRSCKLCDEAAAVAAADAADNSNHSTGERDNTDGIAVTAVRTAVAKSTAADSSSYCSWIHIWWY